MNPLGTRYSFAQLPQIFLPTGAKVHAYDLPSKNAIKYFFNHIVASVLLENNSPAGHKCSFLCGQPVKILIGYPKNVNLRSACPSEMSELLDDFETLLDAFYTEEGEADIELQTVVMRLLPCPKHVEVLEASVYTM